MPPCLLDAGLLIRPIRLVVLGHVNRRPKAAQNRARVSRVGNIPINAALSARCGAQFAHRVWEAAVRAIGAIDKNGRSSRAIVHTPRQCDLVEKHLVNFTECPLQRRNYLLASVGQCQATAAEAAQKAVEQRKTQSNYQLSADRSSIWWRSPLGRTQSMERAERHSEWDLMIGLEIAAGQAVCNILKEILLEILRAACPGVPVEHLSAPALRWQRDGTWRADRAPLSIWDHNPKRGKSAIRAGTFVAEVKGRRFCKIPRSNSTRS